MMTDFVRVLWALAPRKRAKIFRRCASIAVVVFGIVVSSSVVLPVASSAAASGKTRTVTFAELPGSPPDYIFPVAPAQYFTFQNDQEFSYLSYPPLYWIDTHGHPIINKTLSLAYMPTFETNTKGQTVATVKLKRISWSDGTPVTTRDIEFFINLVEANLTKWGDYIPGQFPQNIVSIAYNSPQECTITFNRSYSHRWLEYNEIATIIPIPQQAWDKTSTASPIGNYDETASGAVAVWNYLNGQSRDGGTYATNPLWQVVDGPWRIAPKNGYNAATGYLAMVPNPRYFGPTNHSITRFEELPFTSAAAEFNAVRSGSVDYGFVPPSDATRGLLDAVKSEGYRVAPWYIWGWNFWPLNYAQPRVGPIFKQLYIRQTFEHLINQRGWIRHILQGYGEPEYSPIPIGIKSNFADAYEKTDHYPYSLAAARKLLTAHGWHVVPGGVTRCKRPGSGTSDCGPGVAKGAGLTFTMEYTSTTLIGEEVLSFKAAAAQVGIKLSLTSHPFTQVFANYFSCIGAPSSTCHWEMIAGVLSDEYGWYPDYYPVGATNYNAGASFNGGQYSDPEMNKLTERAHTTDHLAALYAVGNFAAKMLPTLWVPNGPFQISAIKTNLSVPWQGLEVNLYPQLWKWR